MTAQSVGKSQSNEWRPSGWYKAYKSTVTAVMRTAVQQTITDIVQIISHIYWHGSIRQHRWVPVFHDLIFWYFFPELRKFLWSNIVHLGSHNQKSILWRGLRTWTKHETGTKSYGSQYNVVAVYQSLGEELHFSVNMKEEFKLLNQGSWRTWLRNSNGGALSARHDITEEKKPTTA